MAEQLGLTRQTSSAMAAGLEPERTGLVTMLGLDEGAGQLDLHVSNPFV